MKFLKKYGLVLFWAILFLDCLMLNYGFTEYHTTLKLLLMPTLAIYFYAQTRRTKHYSKKTLVYISLLAAFIGDYLLLKNGDVFFIMGMICFLVAYGIYGFLFNQMQPINFKDGIEALFTFLGMLVVSVGLLKVLKLGDLGQLKNYIIVYMLVLSVVTCLAVNVVKNKRLKNIAITKIIPGILIICVSDAILSVHKFYLVDIDFLPVVVMLSYGFGQSLIIEAMCKYLKS
jgi:uncharacterized membrane protein YhhN